MWSKSMKSRIACVVTIAYVMALCPPTVLAQSPTVRLIVNPNKTDVTIGADPIALTAKASGANLKYKWSLQGPGKIEGEGAAVFYNLPEKIEGKSAQAVVTVTVTDDKNQETTDAFTFNILAKDEPAPAVKPATAPATAPVSDTKTGMSTGTKIAIGVGAVALIGGVVVLAASGKEEKKPFDGTFRRTYSARSIPQGYPYDVTETLTLKQSGNSLSGTLREQSTLRNCCPVDVSGNVTGTVLNDTTARISWPQFSGSCSCNWSRWTHTERPGNNVQITLINNNKTLRFEAGVQLGRTKIEIQPDTETNEPGPVGLEFIRE